MIIKTKWLVEYLLLKVTLIFFQRFSLASRYRKIYSFFLFLIKLKIFPLKRIQSNVHLVYHKKSEKTQAKLVSAHIRKTSLLLAEFMELEKMNDQFLEKKVHFLPDQETHYRNLENGALLIMGHLGLLEYCGKIIHYSVQKKKKVFSFIRRMRNPYAEKLFLKIRKNCGIVPIYNDRSIKSAIALLNNNEIVAMPADQDAGTKGPFISFLGTSASTYLGPAFIARKCQAPIYFYYSWHSSRGDCYCAIKEIKRPSEILLKNDRRAWDLEFTHLWVSHLERAVKKHMTDYFWLHQRWRHQPSPKPF